MQRYILGRLLQSLVSMLVVSVVVFALVRLSGDPVAIMMPAEATKADIDLMRAHLGLDRPWPVQYWRFLTQALQGDFGRSVRFRRPAMELIAERYAATLELGAAWRLQGARGWKPCPTMIGSTGCWRVVAPIDLAWDPT